jgi:hypothetical protein
MSDQVREGRARIGLWMALSDVVTPEQWAGRGNEFCPWVETELCPWLDDFDGVTAKHERHERSGCGHGPWATEEL